MDEFIPGFDDPDDELSGYFEEEGNRLNPDLIPKPGLCLLCVKDDDLDDMIECNLIRLDQAEKKDDFECAAFREKKRLI